MTKFLKNNYFVVKGKQTSNYKPTIKTITAKQSTSLTINFSL